MGAALAISATTEAETGKHAEIYVIRPTRRTVVRPDTSGVVGAGQSSSCRAVT